MFTPENLEYKSKGGNKNPYIITQITSLLTLWCICFQSLFCTSFSIQNFFHSKIHFFLTFTLKLGRFVTDGFLWFIWQNTLLEEHEMMFLAVIGIFFHEI